MTIDELIERLEKATGPDCDLERDICIEVTPGVKDAGRIDRGEFGVFGWWPKDTAYQSARRSPHYTASIDAALTLVPKGWCWGLFDEPNAWLWPTPQRDLLAGIQSKGATPAIALCIAALKARRSELDRKPSDDTAASELTYPDAAHRARAQ